MKQKLPIIGLLLLSIFLACKNKTKKKEIAQFELKGSLEGIQNGNVILFIKTDQLFKRDTVKIVNGKFSIKGNYPTPLMADLILDDGVHPDNFLTRPHKLLLVENCKMELKGNAENFHHSVITGSKKQEDYEIYLKDANKILDKYKPEFEKLYRVKPKENPSREELEKGQEQFMAVYNKLLAEKEELNNAFIKKYPKAYYSGFIIERRTYGKSGEQIMAMLDSLSPDLRKQPVVMNIEKKVKEMLAVEIGMEKIMAGASNVSYKVDKSFPGEKLEGIVYLAAFKDNKICALLQDGSVQILDPSGKELKKFKPQLSGAASSIAVDADNKIYLMSTLMKIKKMKVRGKVMKQEIPNGVECHVFNTEGKEENKYSLQDMISATGSRVVDQNLIVADCSKKKISMFNKKNGEAVTTIEDMRPCCGILDFSVNNKKELLVANLGAFKVQGYDYSGKIIVAFGKRGKKLDDFHGCCNPVSVASLSNGAIVTVEKDPTRIKIYSRQGAKQIEGIEEMVKGCAYIPMIVDGKDHLYLASREKGLVKCVPV